MDKYRNIVKKTFPVSLLLENKDCLIVGGGRGIARKLENLSLSGADLTIISPELSPGSEAVRSQYDIKWIRREFEVQDLEGRDLVYCGTSSSALNKEILNECRQRHILCCPIDKNWPEGDFTTPATFRKDELSIAVSTGGASCRRSKLIKQSLSRHVDMIDSSRLMVIGTSHRHMDLEKRESYHLDESRIHKTGMMLNHIWGVHEFLILNTCNRIEILAVVSEDDTVRALIERVLGFDALEADEYYVHSARDAFRHTTTLLAGLYSQTPGENHIVAQVKEAVKTADEMGWSGTILKDWVSRSLGISKKIRNKISPLLKDMEIEDVALDFITAVNGTAARAMVLGTGIIARGISERLLKKGHSLISCYHRNDIYGDDARPLKSVPLTEFRTHLKTVDYVIAATASPHYLLTEEDARLLNEERKTILIDLSLPRNISPSLAESGEHISVADLDDLKHWFRREQADMDKIMDICGTLIEENQDSYDRIKNSFESRKS